jgi:hypothetical protein
MYIKNVIHKISSLNYCPECKVRSGWLLLSGDSYSTFGGFWCFACGSEISDKLAQQTPWDKSMEREFQRNLALSDRILKNIMNTFCI